MSTKRQKLSNDQTGLVSFIVVVIIMFVLSLIVFSFARLVRREQVQTLDRQLNSQAFYAAESGINDALNALSSASPPTGYNDECAGPGSFIDVAGLNNDLGNGISYSCLLVDAEPPTLEVDPVPTGESAVLAIRPAGTQPITQLTLTIRDGEGQNGLSGCPASTSHPAIWPAGCRIGMLRFELVDFDGNPNRDALMKNRGIMFIQPEGGSSGDPQVGWNEIIDGSPLGYRSGGSHVADCGTVSGVTQCTVTITGLNLREGYLRLRSVYREVSITISARTGSGPVDLVGGQAEIDATGRVGGVIKRIKVRADVPINTNSELPIPEFVLQSTESICKRFAVTGPPSNVLNVEWFNPNAANEDCNPRQTVNN